MFFFSPLESNSPSTNAEYTQGYYNRSRPLNSEQRSLNLNPQQQQQQEKRRTIQIFAFSIRNALKIKENLIHFDTNQSLAK